MLPEAAFETFCQRCSRLRLQGADVFLTLNETSMRRRRRLLFFYILATILSRRQGRSHLKPRQKLVTKDCLPAAPAPSEA